MKKAFSRMLIIMIAVVMVISFSLFDLPSLAYADDEYDLGDEVMDFSEYKYCTYWYNTGDKDLEDEVITYGEKLGISKRINEKKFDALDRTIHACLGDGIFSEVYFTYDLDEGDSEDLEANYDDGRFNEKGDISIMYSPLYTESITGSVTITLDEDTKAEFESDKRYYYSSITFIYDTLETETGHFFHNEVMDDVKYLVCSRCGAEFEKAAGIDTDFRCERTVKYVADDKEKTVPVEYGSFEKIKTLSEVFGDDSEFGYFKEWNTKQDGSGTGYEPLGLDNDVIYGITEDIVLYAIWAKKYNIKVVTNIENAGTIDRVNGDGGLHFEDLEPYEGEYVHFNFVTNPGYKRTDVKAYKDNETKDPIEIEFKNPEWELDGPEAWFYMPSCDVIMEITYEAEATDPGKDDSGKEDPGKDEPGSEDDGKTPSEPADDKTTPTEPTDDKTTPTDDTPAPVTPAKKPISIKNAKVSGLKASYAYTGKKKAPTFTVKVNGKKLKKNTDYTVKFTNSKAVGLATITIKGKGNYTGTKKVTFKIIPKKTTLSSLKPAKKAITVKWKKMSTKMTKKRITGYQIQYSLKKNFSSKKSIKVKGYKRTSYKIKNLKSKKRYYVRVRTYMKVGDKTYYSKWSNVKNIKTK